VAKEIRITVSPGDTVIITTAAAEKPGDTGYETLPLGRDEGTFCRDKTDALELGSKISRVNPDVQVDVWRVSRGNPTRIIASFINGKEMT
jgi:hypothetical protein